MAHNAAASWSPDGQQLAFGCDRELHLAARDGTEIRKLGKFEGDPVGLRWSPDGRIIRFSVIQGPVNLTVEERNSGRPIRMWDVRPDGTGLRPVLPEWNPSWQMWSGNWTPDGKYFIFVCNGKIWAVREKGTFLHPSGHEPVQLNTGLLEAEYPLSSVDGKRLFFKGFQARNEFLGCDLKSGRLGLELAGISGRALDFSRDGKWVTYVSVPGGSLFRAAADGSQRLQLTRPPLQASAPNWSPDGKQIAFAASSPEKVRRIYVVSSEGGPLRQLSNGESGVLGDNNPSWSPDGAAVVFGAEYGEKPDQECLHIVDLKTNRVSKLPGSELMRYVRWSPTGDFIAGESVPEAKLMLYDLRTQKRTELFSQGSSANWSKDGEFVYVFKNLAWWRIRVRDGKAELVRSLKGIAPDDWGWFRIAPNDSMIFVHSNGTGEIYALDLELP